MSYVSSSNNSVLKIKDLEDNTRVSSLSDSQFYASDRKMFSVLLTWRMFQTFYIVYF
jgi:hypothetical protein